MRITLWGTRGAITTPGPAKVDYGTNTACVTVKAGGEMLIIDAGIGIVPLAEMLMATYKPKEPFRLKLLLSHLHWDHVIGLPFFTPVFLPGTRLELYGRNVAEMEAAAERLFTSTYSPIKGTKNLGATLSYHGVEDLADGIEGFTVRHAPLRHPGESLAFRIEADGHAMVYASDHEGGDPEIDGRLRALAQGADLLIHDAQWTTTERKRYTGYGHSCWQEAVDTARAADVGSLILFHHQPHRSDASLRDIGRDAAAAAGDDLEVLVARDGMLFEP